MEKKTLFLSFPYEGRRQIGPHIVKIMAGGLGGKRFHMGIEHQHDNGIGMASEHVVFCLEIGVAHAFRGRQDFRRSDSGPRHKALDGRRNVQIVRTESRIREVDNEGRLGERFFVSCEILL